MKIRKFITEYTNEEIDEIVPLYSLGMSLTSISDKLNIVRKVIKKILVQNNVWVENRDVLKINFSEEEKKKIFDLYNNKKFSTRKIANIFGTSNIPIKRILLERKFLRKGSSNGVKINLTQEQKEKIRNLYINEYKSTKEIGKELNLTSSFINKYLTTVNYRRTVSEGVSVGLVKRTGIEYDKYLKNLPEYKKYRLLVVKLTNKQPINLLKNHEKRGVSGIDGAYCLDHKYSIFEGFKNNIKPEVIASLKNLVFIPWRDNVIKRTNCSITKEELINN